MENQQSSLQTATNSNKTYGVLDFDSGAQVQETSDLFKSLHPDSLGC